MENFKLWRKRPPKSPKAERCVIRVSGDAYNMLVRASSETGIPLSGIANRAIDVARSLAAETVKQHREK